MAEKIDGRTRRRSWIMFLAPLLLGSCATIPTEASQSIFRYVSLAPGPSFTYVIDAREAKLSPVIEGALDTVPMKMIVCGSESEFLCFYNAGMTFGVPRAGLDAAAEPWEVNGHSFRVVRRLATLSCGSNFIVESSSGTRSIALFVFNYQLGLQSMIFIESVKPISLDEIAGDVYSFGAVYQADGPGFGGSGSCSALASK